jgi:hypothetical protein
MAIKYINIFQSEALQIFSQIRIFGLKTNHLVTLYASQTRKSKNKHSTWPWLYEIHRWLQHLTNSVRCCSGADPTYDLGSATPALLVFTTQRCVRFGNRNSFPYFNYSLPYYLQRCRCSCKFKSRRMGLRVNRRICHVEGILYLDASCGSDGWVQLGTVGELQFHCRVGFFVIVNSVNRIISCMHTRPLRVAYHPFTGFSAAFAYQLMNRIVATEG